MARVKYKREAQEEHIELSSRVGSILQKERKARKLSLKTAAQESSISMRYLEALENDDFSQFPGETYAIGFLSNYADYLSLDRNRLVTLFRQQQVDTSPSPLQELTRQDSFFASLQFMNFFNKKKVFWTLSLIAFVSAFAFALSLFDFRALSWHLSHWGAPDPYCSGERELRVSNLPIAGGSPRSETLSLQPPDALRISAENLVLKFCLAKVKTENLTSPLGIFHVRIDAKQNYRFQVLEGQSYVFSSDIKEFSGMGVRLKFTPTVLNDFSARIEFETERMQVTLEAETLESGEEKAEEEAEPASPSQTEIQVSLEFIKDSYMEWTQDGRFHRGRLIEAGKLRSLEAKNRLEIKLGNGGGVRISRPHSSPRIAGPIGRIVKLEYRRIPDPLDPGISSIKEFVEIVK